MAQFCDARCGRKARGSIGMLNYCFRCFADIAGWCASDPRLKRRSQVQLMSGAQTLGITEWVPYRQYSSRVAALGAAQEPK